MSKYKNDYQFGEDFEYDLLRSNVNISKVLSGKVKKKSDERRERK